MKRVPISIDEGDFVRATDIAKSMGMSFAGLVRFLLLKEVERADKSVS